MLELAFYIVRTSFVSVLATEKSNIEALLEAPYLVDQTSTVFLGFKVSLS